MGLGTGAWLLRGKMRFGKGITRLSWKRPFLVLLLPMRPLRMRVVGRSRVLVLGTLAPFLFLFPCLCF